MDEVTRTLSDGSSVESPASDSESDAFSSKQKKTEEAERATRMSQVRADFELRQAQRKKKRPVTT